MLNNHDLVTSYLEKTHLDLAFYSSGFDSWKKSQINGPRIRRYHLIHLVQKGRGTLTIGSHKYPVHAGQAFYIPPGISATYQADFHDPWGYCWIGVCGTNAEKYCRLLFGNSYVMEISDTKHYANMIMQMLSCTDARIAKDAVYSEENFPFSLFSDSKTLPQYLFLNGITRQIFADLLLEQEHEFDTAKPISAAVQIRTYLEQHYHEHLLITDMARELGLNPHYASEVFKKRFGITPKQFLTNLRIKQARILLADTECPLKVIANAVGLENPFSFSRLFKSVTGVSPAEYRASLPPLSLAEYTPHLPDV